MGRPKFPRKKYDTPSHPWKEERIKSERDLIKKYGLKNHREVWKAKTTLRKYRGQARELLAKIGGNDPQVKKECDQLLLHLNRMGITPSGSGLDDVLALETEGILSRRLQTLVYHRGFSNTAQHARQLVSHGHIVIGDRKVTIPGYIVPKNEENGIGYVKSSPLNAPSHPARPKTDVYKTPITTMNNEPVKVEKQPQPQTTPQKPEIQQETTSKQPAAVLAVTPPQTPAIAEPKKEPTVTEQKKQTSDIPPKETPKEPKTTEQPPQKEEQKSEKPTSEPTPTVKPIEKQEPNTDESKPKDKKPEKKQEEVE